MAAFISRQTHAILTRLLPDATTLHLEGCEVDEAAVQITLHVRSTQASAPCPPCDTPARRIHRVITRAPSLICPGPTIVCASIYACANGFAAIALPPPHLHRTLAHVASGAPHAAARSAPARPRQGAWGKAAQLGHAWDVVMSRATLLRVLRQQFAASPFPTPRVSGG